MRIWTIFFSISGSVGLLNVFGRDDFVGMGTSPSLIDALTHFMTAVWWYPKYLPIFRALHPLWKSLAASLRIRGNCLFDVYGMTLILLGQSGAKLLKDYGYFDRKGESWPTIDFYCQMC
jgi:hypothetical protein